MSQRITVGEVYLRTVEAHGRGCGCVVCRGAAGEQGAWASATAAMLLGCDFHGIARREHDGIPQDDVFGIQFRPPNTRSRP